MMDETMLEAGLENLVADVDGRRAEGLSAAAACRAAGVSISTYYRRRRATLHSHSANACAVVETIAPPVRDRSWPYAPATPRAPFYWDQVFADEMSDSFVRREFGAGAIRQRASGALSALTAPPSTWAARILPGLPSTARHIWRRIGAGPLGVMAGPLAAAALLALLVVTAGWMVSVAADPAAWLSHPDPARLAANAGPLSR